MKSCTEYDIFDDGFYNKIPNCMVCLALSSRSAANGSGRKCSSAGIQSRELHRKLNFKYLRNELRCGGGTRRIKHFCPPSVFAIVCFLAFILLFSSFGLVFCFCWPRGLQGGWKMPLTRRNKGRSDQENSFPFSLLHEEAEQRF
jgi:hypothetical protein